MRVTYVGCNLFGQVVSSSALSIDRFDAYHVDHPLIIDVALGHSIIAYLKTDGLYFHGHGLEPKKTHHITKVEAPPNAKLICVADTRVFLLDNEGALHVMDFLNKEPKFLRKPPVSVEGDSSDKIIDFVAGTRINLALTAAGKLYNIPNVLDLELMGNSNIKKLRAGHEHALILDNQGRVYSVGNGRRGQLGLGNLSDQETPCQVETLGGIFIIDIACGGWHCLALSRDGDVYIWGWNSDGQLGLVDEKGEALSVVQIPQYLPLPDELNVSHIAAGSRHSICITNDNNVYAFGCNKFNQLGLPNDKPSIIVPEKVHEIQENLQVLRVICGPTSTMILTEE